MNVLDVFASAVVGKLTTVVSVRHDGGGVKIVVRAPRFADAKSELKLDIFSSSNRERVTDSSMREDGG